VAPGDAGVTDAVIVARRPSRRTRARTVRSTAVRVTPGLAAPSATARHVAVPAGRIVAAKRPSAPTAAPATGT
jgi:hypothetical protein